MYHVLADLVLLAHLAFVAFVVIGQGLIVWGGCRGWRWVRNPWFRYAHLLAIGFVVVQAWCGGGCPLTDGEMALREKAGDLTYHGTFLAHWLHRILFFEAPAWCFTLGYTLFGVVVVACWAGFKPRSLRASDQ